MALAIRLHDTGGPEVLKLVERPMPVAGEDCLCRDCLHKAAEQTAE